MKVTQDYNYTNVTNQMLQNQARISENLSQNANKLSQEQKEINQEVVDILKEIDVELQEADFSKAEFDYRINKKTGGVNLVILDAQTKEVIKEVPPEYMVKIQEKLSDALRLIEAVKA